MSDQSGVVEAAASGRRCRTRGGRPAGFRSGRRHRQTSSGSVDIGLRPLPDRRAGLAPGGAIARPAAVVRQPSFYCALREGNPAHNTRESLAALLWFSLARLGGTTLRARALYWGGVRPSGRTHPQPPGRLARLIISRTLGFSILAPPLKWDPFRCPGDGVRVWGMLGHVVEQLTQHRGGIRHHVAAVGVSWRNPDRRGFPGLFSQVVRS